MLVAGCWTANERPSSSHTLCEVSDGPRTDAARASECTGGMEREEAVLLGPQRTSALLPSGPAPTAATASPPGPGGSARVRVWVRGKTRERWERSVTEGARGILRERERETEMEME